LKRRDFVWSAAVAGAGLSVGFGRTAASDPSQAKPAQAKPMQEGYARNGQIYYQLHGDPKGVPLFLGFPIMASHEQIFGEAQAGVRNGFLERLTDRYRVLLVDYPNIGKTTTPSPAEFTIDRACADMLAAADAAGFGRFAWWGPTSNGVQFGLALAARSDRVSAFVGGGWPPLGAPYEKLLLNGQNQVSDPPQHALVILRDKSQYAQWVTYYESMTRWPEAKAVASIKCPRMIYFPAEYSGSGPGLTFMFADIVREHRAELEKMGWRVVELAGPVRDGRALFDPALVVPVGREFLDAVT